MTQARYSVEGMEQILGAMIFMGHIRSWSRDHESWGNEIVIQGPKRVNPRTQMVETKSWVFSENWFRAELVKMDRDITGYDPGYVILMHSGRIPEMLSLMENRYQMFRAEVVS